MGLVQPGHTSAAGNTDGAGLPGFGGIDCLEKQVALVSNLDHIDVKAHHGAPVDGPGVAVHHDHIGGVRDPLWRLTDINPDCRRGDAAAADIGKGGGHQFTAPAQMSPAGALCGLALFPPLR